MNGKFRIGKKVFHVDKDLWIQCKEAHVTDNDIQNEYDNYMSVGIDISRKRQIAIASALRKKKLTERGRVVW